MNTLGGLGEVAASCEAAKLLLLLLARAVINSLVSPVMGGVGVGA